MSPSKPRPAARAPGFQPPVVTARGGEGGLPHRSTAAHVQYWIGDDIAVEIDAGRMLAAYSAWNALAKGTGLPRLRDFLESEARAVDDDLLLYLKLADDYLVVSQGAERRRHLGRDLRGMLMSDMTISVGHVLKELYDDCFAQRTPIYARFVTDLAADSIQWEGLFLPLSGGDGSRIRFLASCAAPIDSKTDVLQMVLDRSPIGTIVAVPVGDGGGDKVDGRIVLINARAKEILKFDEKGSRVSYIHDLAPWLRDIAGWTRVKLTVEGRRTRLHYRDPANRKFVVTMESLNRFILFSIAEYDGDIAAPPGEDADHSSGASTIGS